MDIDGVEAWRTGTGAGAVVAVIDTGVDATHPDLAGRVLPGKDFSGSSTGATVDRVGHGTQVASVIASNGTDIAGVAPDARILPLKVYRDSATSFSMSGYLNAIRYAADQGVDVINISLGCGPGASCFSQAEQDAIAYANDHGVLVVVAAGNGANGAGLDNDDPDTPDYPSGYDLPNLVSVTSSSQAGAGSSWANFGATTVDIAAPGEAILVASPGDSFRSVRGTSFASPIVAGTAALVAAANPSITPDDLRGRLIASAQPTPSLRGRTVSGGIVNAQAALGVGTSGPSAPTATGATVLTPGNRVKLAAPPTLTWKLPLGWRAERVLVRQGARTFDQNIAATRRSLAHPAQAWQGGTYTWRVVAIAPSGQRYTSANRSYTILPRLGAWVTSGRLNGRGRDVRLRIGYAANLPRATTRVTVLLGSKVLHTGKTVTRTSHVRGAGSPRRAWFAYNARVQQALRPGQQITVIVRVDAGGATLTRRFNARVA